MTIIIANIISLQKQKDMGTLYDQEGRAKYQHYLQHKKSTLIDVTKLVEEDGFTKSEAIELLKVAEMRMQNYLYLDNGDIWDEQIAGIGKILEDIAQAIRSNSDNL